MTICHVATLHTEYVIVQSQAQVGIYVSNIDIQSQLVRGQMCQVPIASPLCSTKHFSSTLDAIQSSMSPAAQENWRHSIIIKAAEYRMSGIVATSPMSPEDVVIHKDIKRLLAQAKWRQILFSRQMGPFRVVAPCGGSNQSGTDYIIFIKISMCWGCRLPSNTSSGKLEGVHIGDWLGNALEGFTKTLAEGGVLVTDRTGTHMQQTSHSHTSFVHCRTKALPSPI